METHTVAPEIRKDVRVRDREDRAHQQASAEQEEDTACADTPLPGEHPERNEHRKRKQLHRDRSRGNCSGTCRSPDGPTPEPADGNCECDERQRNRRDGGGARIDPAAEQMNGLVEAAAGGQDDLDRQERAERIEIGFLAGLAPGDLLGRLVGIDESRHPLDLPRRAPGKERLESQQCVEARRLRGEDVAPELLAVAKRVEAREVDPLVVVRSVVQSRREQKARDDEQRAERRELELLSGR